MYTIQKQIGNQWQYVLDILTSSYEKEIISFMKSITTAGETLRLVKDGRVIYLYTVMDTKQSCDGIGSESKTALRINKR